MRWESVNDVSWARHYAACKAYHEEHGDLNMPGDYVTDTGVQLGRWIIAVRRYRRSGIKSSYFTPERERMLDELGMIWNTPDYLWDRNYAAAKAYHAEHGDLDVPTGYIQDGVKLYNWLASLRKMYRGAPGRRGELTPEQIAQMDELGMRWKSKNDLVWDKGYTYAKAYYEEHGAADADVFYVTSDGFKLGMWLSKCREKYAKGTLGPEKIRQLEAINMVWNKSRKNDWDECFEKVREYYLANGDLSIPPDYVADGVWLSKWLNEQKQVLLGNRKGKTLTEEQKQKLASVSFTVEGNREVRWQQRYNELLRYYSTHGNSRLPVGYTDSQGADLYTWLAKQKTCAKTGKLSSERQRLLREIGALSAW